MCSPCRDGACGSSTSRWAKTTFTIGGIETFQETARRNRLQAVTRVIRFETIIATEQFAAESGFSEGDELWAVQRVRYLDGKALILDIKLLFKGICTRTDRGNRIPFHL